MVVIEARANTRLFGGGRRHLSQCLLGHESGPGAGHRPGQRRIRGLPRRPGTVAQAPSPTRSQVVFEYQCTDRLLSLPCGLRAGPGRKPE